MTTPPTVTITDRASDWGQIISRHYLIDLAELRRLWPHERSFRIDTGVLLRGGRLGLTLLQELVQSPDQSLGHVREALRDRLGYECSTGVIDVNAIEIRPTNYHYVTPVGRIRAGHTNTLVALDGIVRRATQPVAKMTRAVFRCRSCGAVTDPIPQSRRQVEEPDVCPRCERKSRFDLVRERSSFVDYQRVQLTENPEGSPSQPAAIDVDLVGDIVGSVQPGDRVRMTGILRTHQQTIGVQRLPDFKYYLECTGIRTEEKTFEEVAVTDDEEVRIRALAAQPDVHDLVARAIAPSVYGYDRVKQAIALQLFGGVRKSMADGTPRRGDIHVLLVGDPGIAKSVLLRYAVRAAPRGIYTSGQGTTRAGLTAAAVKDDFSDGRWMLEAGALVLADMGLAAVDELDKMSDGDRSGLHEAMEQQSVSIAKAGITATLRSRCALLGAANPKRGRFDPVVPLAEQIDMPPSLLSRFDLIFALQDVADPETDARLSRHIIGNHRQGGEGQEGPDDDALPADLLRKWVKLARDLRPALTDAAEEAVHQFYLGMRGGVRRAGAPIPITPRQEEAIIRLAEAAARMRLSETVSADDVRVAIVLMDSCLRDVAYDPGTNEFDIDRLYTGANQTDRTVEREIEALVRAAGGRLRVSEIFETCMERGYGLDQIDRTLTRMESRVEFSISKGVLYQNES